MKFGAYYSLPKFGAFDHEAKLQAIDKLIASLEMALGDEPERIRIIEHLLELQSLLPQGIPRRLSLFFAELNPRLSPHQLLNKLYFYHDGALRKDSQLPLKMAMPLGEVSPELRKKASDVRIICDNLRSVFNMGSLFRIAECLGLAEIMICGISPTPDHPHLAKTAMGTQQLVSWQYFESTFEAIATCRNNGNHIFALETSSTAKSAFGCSFSFPMALVVGNEALGIDPEVLAECDETVYLPQLGWKSSLNVGVASSVALYQIIFGA